MDSSDCFSAKPEEQVCMGASGLSLGTECSRIIPERKVGVGGQGQEVGERHPYFMN